MLLNAASQGRRSNDGNVVFVGKELQLAPGENKIEASAERNGQCLRDSCEWTGPPGR